MRGRPRTRAAPTCDRRVDASSVAGERLPAPECALTPGTLVERAELLRGGGPSLDGIATVLAPLLGRAASRALRDERQVAIVRLRVTDDDGLPVVDDFAGDDMPSIGLDGRGGYFGGNSKVSSTR